MNLTYWKIKRGSRFLSSASGGGGGGFFFTALGARFVFFFRKNIKK